MFSPAKTRGLLVALGLLQSACWVDPGALEQFACDEGGSCPSGFSCCDGQCLKDGCEAPPADAGNTDAGAVACGPDTCSGCCEATVCVAGIADSACGTGGVDCASCAEGMRCESSGACVSLSPNGTACASSMECQSQWCVDGVCCERACDGACDSCALPGSEGRCVPLVEGATGVPSCEPRACDGLGGQCPSTCTSLRQCIPGHYCDSGGACVPQKPNGQPCGAGGECGSGYCADGVCCDGACTGSCDRCNLTGQTGSCRPAPSGDPGQPACGGSYTCNGTSVDCPIPCSAGCPTGTYCGGTYCAAKRINGVSCTQAAACLSGFCVDGVCCDAACAGECDACSVALGASTDGTCALLGASKICRSASNVCDKEERCDGASAACPSNAYQPSTVVCQASGYTAWSSCQSGGNVCATSGTQTRQRTDHLCDGAGACGSSSATETQSCSQTTEGLSCGTTTYGSWSACTPSALNSCTGMQSRSVTMPKCASGTCANDTSTETRACNVELDVSCGATQYGSWGNCTSSPGSCAGSQSRQVTTYACDGAGTCASNTSTATQACTQSQGSICNTTTYSAWSSCAQTVGCAGLETRTRTDYTCNASASCTGAGTTESRSCTLPDAAVCASTSYSAWSTCTGPTTSCGGTQSRSVTSYACQSGSCNPSSSSQTQSCFKAAGTACGSFSCVNCEGRQPQCDGAGNCNTVFTGYCPPPVGSQCP